jgi:hypothetical protein
VRSGAAGIAAVQRAELTRLDWATLLQRVWGVDALDCGRCGGRMRFIAVIKDRAVKPGWSRSTRPTRATRRAHRRPAGVALPRVTDVLFTLAVQLPLRCLGVSVGRGLRARRASDAP